MLLDGVTIDLFSLPFRDLMNVVHAFVVRLTPESVGMIQALDGEDTTTEDDILQGLSGDEPADVQLARAAGDRTISIREALSAGGLDLLDDLRASMEAGATNPLG